MSRDLEVALSPLLVFTGLMVAVADPALFREGKPPPESSVTVSLGPLAPVAF